MFRKHGVLRPPVTSREDGRSISSSSFVAGFRDLQNFLQSPQSSLKLANSPITVDRDRNLPWHVLRADLRGRSGCLLPAVICEAALRSALVITPLEIHENPTRFLAKKTKALARINTYPIRPPGLTVSQSHILNPYSVKTQAK